MINGVVERKAIELECKLASLSSELAAWLRDSEEKGPLEKHHTQIRAVARALEPSMAAASERLQAARDQDLLGDALALEAMVLEIHRIWDFFREKLALRFVAHFALPLVAADELAWRCYQPAQANVPEGQGREPPLVYLNGASSPLTLERGKRFQAEAVEAEPMQWSLTAAALEALPVPVLGIPWFQVEHLPDAPIIAHEVGHDVEIDLGLTHRIAELLIAAVAAARRDLWVAWAGEVFADVYCSVALGPAFATTLVDFLADDGEAIAAEERAPGDGQTYPTTALRVLLAAAVLDETNFATEAADLRRKWRASVARHAMEDYEADLAPVAHALVSGPYPQIYERGLDQLIGFGRARHDQAEADAKRLLKRMAPQADNARVLVAAARLAFDRNPSLYIENGAGARVVKRIQDKRDVGVRFAATQAAPAAARIRRDAAAGAALLAMLNDKTGGRDV